MRVISIILLMLLLPSFATAQVELRRKKNTGTYIVFPIRNASTGANISAAAGLDSECSTFADASVPGSFADCTNEATELGTTGVYYLLLTSTETNADMVAVQVKTSSSNAITPTFTINTRYGVPITDANGNLAGSTGTFASGSTTTIVNLNAGETANDITDQCLCVDSGTAAKDCARITAYNTGTKAATLSPILTNAPASGDSYSIYPICASGSGGGGGWSDTVSSYNTPGTFGYLFRRIFERRD